MSSKEDDVEKDQIMEADDKETALVLDSVVEQEIRAEYQLINDLIHSMDDLYIQYYGGQDGVQPHGGNQEEVEIKEHGEPALENAERAKERPKIPFLVQLQKSWARIAGLKWKRTSSIKEPTGSCDIPGSSHISVKANVSSKEQDNKGSSHDRKSITGDICLEQPDLSGERISTTIPLSLESFTFLRTLGQGSFGQVFLARDIIRKECVAIKVSDKRDFTEAGYSLIERHVLQLSHESPYLIHGLAAFHTLNFVYYVMELATRGDLLDLLLKNFPLNHATIQFIAAEVVCGTEFLHKKGILHRDLKLENILLTTDGHVKITDFGLAVKGVYKRTKEECKGTAGYAAPELVKGLAHGRGVDYFAIGVILYRLCAFGAPFPGKNPREMDHSVLHHAPLYPESLAPDTVNILQGLLCKDHFQRLGVNGDIKNHPFFSNTNWEDVEARRTAPPAILTAACVDLNNNQTLDYAEMPNRIRSKDQKIFNQFSFVCPEWSRHYHPLIVQTNTQKMTKLFTKRSFWMKEK